MPGATKLGLVLGGGAARGLAHVGVLAELDRLGLRPDIVTGCSAGALTAAMYLTRGLEGAAEMACSFPWLRSAFSIGSAGSRGGPLDPNRLVARLQLPDVCFEDLDRRLGVAATDLGTGRERWLMKGSLRRAVAASIALPGLFRPVWHDGAWLADGGLVDPLPVSLCRALGATNVIAASLGGEPWQRGGPTNPALAPEGAAVPEQAVRRACPTYVATVVNAATIMSEFITRVRIASDPPDVLVLPEPGRVGLLDFHRGQEAIEAGRAAVRRAEPALESLRRRPAPAAFALAS
ncbi:MAG: patatin-like phospholipase family protein [Geminicoccaceae bacterium]